MFCVQYVNDHSMPLLSAHLHYLFALIRVGHNYFLFLFIAFE